MGRAVPAVAPGAKPTWTVRIRQLRISNLGSVHFVNDQEGFAGGWTATDAVQLLIAAAQFICT